MSRGFFRKVPRNRVFINRRHKPSKTALEKGKVLDAFAKRRISKAEAYRIFTARGWAA